MPLPHEGVDLALDAVEGLVDVRELTFDFGDVLLGGGKAQGEGALGLLIVGDVRLKLGAKLREHVGRDFDTVGLKLDFAFVAEEVTATAGEQGTDHPEQRTRRLA